MAFKTKYDMATQTHKKVKPDASAPVGQGGRFAALSNKLGKKPGVDNPDALAASIGRKKYGANKFNSLSAKGKSNSYAPKQPF